MSAVMRAIRSMLASFIEEIDAGNSELSDADAVKVAEVLRSYADKTEKLSKYQACRYLNMSRSSFDQKVRDGLLPRGKKTAGFKELFWEKKDLDKVIKD